MRSALLFFLLLRAALLAQTSLNPTTTLSAETANNTSAADSFAGETNGNIAATNISKMPIRSLLYSGATTKIYAHLMPWFGTSYHVNVGYDSADPAQAARQVADMASRGIDGVIVDWYGPNSTQHNTATKNVLASSALTPNFEFAICEDYGAVSGSSNPTQETINDLNYAWTTFMQSPAYMRRNSRPVIFFFGFEGQAVDLSVVKAALTFNPLFVMRNSGGFSEVASDGSFSWLAPLTSGYDTYMSLLYLDGFYSAELGVPAELAFGSAFKGFNDTLASWAPPGGRHIPQFCGQTWLSSFAEAAKYFSSNNQLPALQIVTWNDYEEGTALEPGIDNCVSISSWMSGKSLNWSITGQESTLDHYTVYGSADGVNLAKIADFPTGTASTDLSALGLAAGNYQFFVKAVAKPSMANHMSSAVAYSVAAPVASVPPPAPAADYGVKLTPSSVQIAKGSSAQMTLQVSSVQGAYSSAVNFACQGLPANMTCNFAQTALIPGTSGASTTLTIATTTAVGKKTAPRFGWELVPAFGVVISFGAGLSGRRKRLLAMVFAGVVLCFAAGCGSKQANSAPATTQSQSSPVTYSITILATSGSLSHSAVASVTIQ